MWITSDPEPLTARLIYLRGKRAYRLSVGFGLQKVQNGKWENAEYTVFNAVRCANVLAVRVADH